jgi:hypothetical protein
MRDAPSNRDAPSPEGDGAQQWQCGEKREHGKGTYIYIHTYMHIERNNHRASPMGFICFFIFSPPITPKVGQQLQPFGSI